MADWMIRHNGKQIGPIGSAKLKELARSGRLSRDCEVQEVGKESWHPITKIKGLFPDELITAPAHVANVPEPVYQPPAYTPQPMQPQFVVQAPAAPAPIINVTTVVNNVQGKRWSRGVAGVLSFLIPGLGQIYKGQPINGLLWFFFVIAGYICFIVPGLILHVLCVLGAMSGRNH